MSRNGKQGSRPCPRATNQSFSCGSSILEFLDLPVKNSIEYRILIICARDGKRLIGIVRALTDFCFCCYVSDLAVDREYQGKGIGKELLRRVKMSLSEEVMILLLSLPGAHAYYPHLGYKKEDHAWVIPRKR